MAGSRTILVAKRDGTCEPFDVRKLTSAIARAAKCDVSGGGLAASIASAIQTHTRNSGYTRICSRSIFEMSLKVLRRISLPMAAHRMESYFQLRNSWRRAIKADAGNGKLIRPEKRYLAEEAVSLWGISRTTARIIAARIERHLIAIDNTRPSPEGIRELINRYVCEHGLADAVPVNAPPADNTAGSAARG